MEDYKKIIREEYIKCANDPSHFLKKYVKITHPQRGRIPFHTFPFQDKVLKLFERDTYKLILKARQLGLTTLVAGYVLWLMTFHEDKSILCVATKQSVAKKLVTMVKYMWDSLPSWLKEKHVTKNELTLEFTNGSIVVATSSATDAGRSEAVSLLIIDEAAFISNIEKIWKSSRGTLSTGGDCIILSTPNGQGNWFHDRWEKAILGGDEVGEFLPIKLPWYVHPERDQEWRDKEDIRYGDAKFAAQECDCDFSTSGDGVFEGAHIKFYEETYVKDPLFKRGEDQNLWVWESPDYSRDYIVVADTGRGDDKDYSTFHVIDVESITQVAEFRARIGTTEFGNLLVGVATEYNEALLVIERENVGWATIQTVIGRNYPNLYYSPKGDTARTDSYFDKYADKSKMIAGISSNLKTRPLFISKLQEYVGTKAVIIQSARTITEMKVFIWKDGKVQAQSGHHDDLVIPLAIGMYIRDTALILRQRGIELTKAAISGIRKSQPISKGFYSSNKVNNPYKWNVGGKMESLDWMLSNRRKK